MKNIDINFPKRKIKKTFRSFTGFFPSVKNGRSIAFESILEKQLFLSLEFNKSVKRYLEQPVKIAYKVLGKKRSYHPDCFIEYCDGKSKLIEVKYTTDLKEHAEELEVKFNAAREYASMNDMEFDIFTEHDIKPVELDNCTFLYTFATVKIDEKYMNKIMTVLHKNIHITITQLLEKLSQSKYEQARMLPCIWKMVFDGLCYVEYKNSELSMNSYIGVEKQ